MLTIFRRKPARFRHMVSHLADEVQGKRCRSLATTSLSAQQSRPSDAAYRDSLASLIRQKLLHHHGFCRCACTAAASLGYAEHHVALRSRGRQGVEGVAGRLKRLKLQDLTPRKKRSQCRMCSGGRERICERSRLYKSLSVPALPALWSTTSSAVQVGNALDGRHGSHQRAGASLAVDECSWRPDGLAGCTFVVRNTLIVQVQREQHGKILLN